jgi:hypothetical protein
MRLLEFYRIRKSAIAAEVITASSAQERERGDPDKGGGGIRETN